MKPQPTQPAASQRLLSLDALRGFDMLFIMGFAGLVTALCKLCPGEFSDWMTAQMGHADWNGFFHHDTISRCSSSSRASRSPSRSPNSAKKG